MNIQEILENEIKYIESLECSGKAKCKLKMSMYRMLTFDSQLYALLHGSTAITKRGNAVLCGDGIDCIGKTTTSMYIACSSGKYVIDENTIYNQATGSVYGNKECPVLIRPDIAEGIEKAFNKKLPEREEGFNYSVLPSYFNLEVADITPLKAIVAPHFGDRNELVEEKNPIMKSRKVAIVAHAHRLKMIEPSLDRINGDVTDGSRKVDLIDLTVALAVPDGLLRIPYYDAYLSEASNIVDLLERGGL